MLLLGKQTKFKTTNFEVTNIVSYMPGKAIAHPRYSYPILKSKKNRRREKVRSGK
jgi:hypothetical protein